MKRLLILLAALLCLCGPALAEAVTDNDDGTTPTDLLPELTRRTCIVDLTLDPDAEWSFVPDKPILEIVFPQVVAADACILRMDGHVMLIDAGGVTEVDALRQALEWMGITHVETGLCTHPHHDHLPGFSRMAAYVKLDRLLSSFSRNTNQSLVNEIQALEQLKVPVEQVSSGDVLTLAGAGEKIYLFQAVFEGSSINDRSLMARIVYGQRSILLTADIEKAAQKCLISAPPACGLSADILKYPHHGIARMQNALVELIRPRLAIVTNTPEKSTYASTRMAEYFVPVLYTSDGAIRLRTDGIIWVLDRLTGPET